VNFLETEKNNRIEIVTGFLCIILQASWYNAYLFCRDNGMRLATVNSLEEETYLSDLVKDLGKMLNITYIYHSVSENGHHLN